MTHGGNVWRGEAPESWLDFSANLRPEGPPDWVIQAIEGAMGEIRYYPDPDMRRERNALGAALGVDAACVLPTNGGIATLGLADLIFDSIEGQDEPEEKLGSKIRSMFSRS